MCAVIGCYLKHPTESQIETLKKLFIESQIRGRHQTGLCVLHTDNVWRYVVEGDGEKLVEKFNWASLNQHRTLQLIGHNRYSTSDLRYPQPIQVFSDLALAHNGVVTQEPVDQWGKYGYELTTANDSELLYHCVYQGEEPLKKYPDASMAVVELSKMQGLRWYRNGKRPLYMVKQENGYFICSTADIARRVGLKRPKKCKPGVVYTPTSSTTIVKTPELIP